MQVQHLQNLTQVKALGAAEQRKLLRASKATQELVKGLKTALLDEETNNVSADAVALVSLDPTAVGMVH